MVGLAPVLWNGTVRWNGAAKSDPFLIVVIKNPVLEEKTGNGVFFEDPIQSQTAQFHTAAVYVEDCLAGRLPGQVEPAYIDPAFHADMRLIWVEFDNPPIDDTACFVGHRGSLLEARQAAIARFLASERLVADVVFAISGSQHASRASAHYTYDDQTRPSVPFSYIAGGVTHMGEHGKWPRIPGSVALHLTDTSLTATHEFGHAISSHENGRIVDLYLNRPLGLNKRRPQPPTNSEFADYMTSTADRRSFAWDPHRTNIGYDAAWDSFHCETTKSSHPAVMDNYWMAPNGDYNACIHDEFTRKFIRDRVASKLSR